ncbi:MAG TPA: GNAT family N-acetyltransferase [Anaerolineales bacterium]|nr:GNAT family N-acetyltransferase [Anaerolineales bacterium]
MLEPRPYHNETDLDAMRTLLQAGHAANNGTYYVYPGDLNWWWYYHDPKKHFPERTFLWEQDGQLLGWTLIAKGAMDVYVVPHLRGTSEAAEMYVWAEERLAEFTRQEGGKEIETIWVGEYDAWFIDHLEKRGFTRDTTIFIYNTCSLDGEIPDPVLPLGYTVRGMGGSSEAPSRARASYGAFQSKKDWEPYLQNYRNFTQAPIYNPELDVVAVAPNGEIAAFAICWLDPVNGIGHFEPVGTHPDYQRKGLGRAVLYEGMRRMKARGMRKASVCVDGDNPAGVGVYAAAGFTPECKILTYKKALENPPHDE